MRGTSRNRGVRWARLVILTTVGAIGCSTGLDGPVDLVETDPDPVPPSVIQWLQDTAIPITTSDPGASFEDLEPLRELIGDARIVALGQATYGTGDFHDLQHRLLRFLVQELDFNVFGLEASMPEARRIDAYIKGQPGDAAELLSGLYFWTLNTREVLDEIEWMRVHNQSPGNSPVVSFTGFDMQFPGMAVQNIERFLSTHAPDSAAMLINDFECMRDFLNGPDGTADQPQWQTLGPTERSDCRLRVENGPVGYLSRHENDLAAEVSEAALEQIRQDARLVLQWEGYESVRAAQGRDRAMADNALWILEQAGPDAKMVIWGHNVHVSLMEDWQGDYLRDELGEDFLSVGFLFGQGRFNAITREFGGGFRDVERQEVAAPPSLTYEYRFGAAGLPIMMLDLRNLDTSVGAGDWLAATRWFRSVGAIYEPENPVVYFLREEPITDLFDALLYVDVTRASSLLPFRYPSTF